MKKLFLLFALVGMNVLAYSQDVKVNINNQDATAKDDCPYRINGICATEDIGGVDIEVSYNSSDDSNICKLTNYNSFPVSVLLALEYNDIKSPLNEEKKTSTIVLGVEGVKEIELPRVKYVSGEGRCYYSASKWSVIGLIVRKLAQQ